MEIGWWQKIKSICEKTFRVHDLVMDCEWTYQAWLHAGRIYCAESTFKEFQQISCEPHTVRSLVFNKSYVPVSVSHILSKARIM